MVILKDVFMILFYLGLWKPPAWQGWQSILYTLWTSCVVMIGVTFFITEFLDLILLTSNIVEFTNNVFLMSSVLSSCLKSLIILKDRKIIDSIIDQFKVYFDEIDDNEELNIFNSCTRLIKFISKGYLITTIVGLTLVSYVQKTENAAQYELFYRAWLPYNYSSPRPYWLTTAAQVGSLYIIALIHVVFSLIFSGFLLYISAFINIFKFQLRRSTSDEFCHSYVEKYQCNLDRGLKKFIQNKVKTYLSIRRLFDTVENLFSSMILYQYMMGSIILCSSTYNMSQVEPFSVAFFSIVGYMINMSIELFIICMACNEITVQFEGVPDALYHGFWYKTNISNRKSIVIMMTHTVKPVYFTCGYIINLSFDSFTSVIKLSYSIYNVIQSSF